MNRVEHRRHFESFDKFSFYCAGFLFTAIMSFQTLLQIDQLQTAREMAKTSSDQKSSISSIVTRLGVVVENQTSLRNTVRDNHIQLSKTIGDVEKKIISICARSQECD